MKQGQSQTYRLMQQRAGAATMLAVPPSDVKWTVKGPGGFVWEQQGSGDGTTHVARVFAGPAAISIADNWLSITVQYLDAGTFSVDGACISLNAGANKLETVEPDPIVQKLVIG